MPHAAGDDLALCAAHGEPYGELHPGAQGSPDEPLDTKSGERMIPVVAAMSRVENGTPARMDEVRAGWDLFTKYPV